MYHNFITKDNRTSNLYRERRMQHRYHRNNEKSEPVNPDFIFTPKVPFDPKDQIKPGSLSERDEWIFSDNRIKNFKPPSRDNNLHQTKITINVKEKIQDKVTPESPEESPKTPPFNQELGLTPRRALLSPEKSHRYCIEGDKITSLGKLRKNSKVVQSQQVKKRINSALDRRKYMKKNSLSMQISSKHENTLVPTVVSVKLSNPTHVEKKIDSQRATITSISYQKQKNKGKSCYVMKDKRVVAKKNDPVDKMKFSIIGWEDENPSFHEFEEIYSNSRQQKELTGRQIKTAGGQRPYLRRQVQ